MFASVADPGNILTFERPSTTTHKLPLPFSLYMIRESQAQFREKLRKLRLKQNDSFSIKKVYLCNRQGGILLPIQRPALSWLTRPQDHRIHCKPCRTFDELSLFS